MGEKIFSGICLHSFSLVKPIFRNLPPFSSWVKNIFRNLSQFFMGEKYVQEKRPCLHHLQDLHVNKRAYPLSCFLKRGVPAQICKTCMQITMRPRLPDSGTRGMRTHICKTCMYSNGRNPFSGFGQRGHACINLQDMHVKKLAYLSPDSARPHMKETGVSAQGSKHSKGFGRNEYLRCSIEVHWLSIPVRYNTTILFDEVCMQCWQFRCGWGVGKLKLKCPAQDAFNLTLRNTPEELLNTFFSGPTILQCPRPQSV